MRAVSSRVRWLGAIALGSALLTVVSVGASFPGETVRVSLSNSSVQGTDSSVDASISGNGNLVAFKSNAPNLVASDTNGSTADIFIRDRAAGTTRLVSLAPDGTQFAASSEEPVISYDGTTVSWETANQVYVRSIATGPTQLVSRTPGNLPASGVSREPSLSTDGQLVAYWSTANDLGTLDPAFTADVFVFNRGTATTELGSVGNGNLPAPIGSDSYLPSLSGDGRYLVYETRAPFDAANDTNGTFDIYLRDRTAGTTTLVSRTGAGAAGNAQSFEGNGGPVISQDGSTVAFVSNASDLVVGDTNNRSDVFVYHVGPASIERASVTSAGAEGSGASARPTINADGTLVGFQSESQLHVWDTNTDIDIYVRHLGVLPKKTTLESVSSGGQSVSGNKVNPDLNGDGKLVAYHSASSSLVSGDTNGRDDVFVHELGVADTTPPTVTGVATTPPNADGWYSGSVTVQWTAVDPEPSSGQPANPPNTIVTTQGKDQIITSSPACDANANCATGSIKLSIDLTSPTVVPTYNTANGAGWNSTDVVVGFTCGDLLSGVASCPGAVHFTAEGVGLTIPTAGRTAVDRAGNTATATVPPIGIDFTPPTITYGGSQTYDMDGTVAITCAASDSLSGIASTTCSNVSGPAYLFAIGQNIVTSTVVDKAGNTTSGSYSFTVAPTLDGLRRLVCALIGVGGAGQGHGHDSEHDGDDAKKTYKFCKKLSDDLDDADRAAKDGNSKKHNDAVQKFLKDAAQAGKLLTAQQLRVLGRAVQGYSGGG